MEITHFKDMRPRTVWDVVDDALDLYRENLALFGGIVLLLLVPGGLLYGGWLNSTLGAFILQTTTGSDPDMALFGRFFGEFAIAIGLFTIGFILYSAATVTAVQNRLAGAPSSVLTAYRQALRRFWPLLGASLLVGFLAMLGVCTLYIMTVVVLVFYAFISQAIVLEGCGVMEGGRRSRALVSGNGWRVFGMLLLIMMLSQAIAAGISVLIQLLLLIPAVHGPDLATQQTRELMLSQAAQWIGSALISPVAPIATTLMYYDLRVRREGLDLEAYARHIGFPLAPDPYATGARAPMPLGPEITGPAR